MIDKWKNWWGDNKHRITPWYRFGRDAVTVIASVPEDPNVFHYLDCGLEVKDLYNDYFSGKKIRRLVKGKKRVVWDIGELKNSVFNELREQKGVICLGREEDAAAFLLDLDGTIITWLVGVDENEGVTLYCEPEHREKLRQSICNLLYKSYNSNHLVVKFYNEKLLIQEDKSTEKFIDFKKCQELRDYLGKFFDQNINRSVLFYGPPGSGKSNLIRGIISKIGARTLKFGKLQDMSYNTILSCIEFLNPDCLVFEDLDHIEDEDIDQLFTDIEHLVGNTKLILASANEIDILDDALIRPGRFDEIIEIKSLDEGVLRALIASGDPVEDEKLFKLVKDYPVAYTQEILKRIKVLGRTEALKNVKDVKIRIDKLKDNNYSLGEEEVVPSKRGRKKKEA